MNFKEYYWYLESLTSETNAFLAEYLNEDDCGEFQCVDGERRFLWRAPRWIVTKVENESQNQSPIKARVFVQEGSRGQIRPWKFNQNRSSRTAGAMAMARRRKKKRRKK